jgi:hypothetical protein
LQLSFSQLFTFSRGWAEIAEHVTEHAVLFQAGDRVRGIGAAGVLDSLLNVRIESGEHSGVSCWMPMEFSKDIKDIHDDSGSQ